VGASANRIIASTGAAAGAAPMNSLEARTLSGAYAAALVALCGCIWGDLERCAELLQPARTVDAPAELLWPAATLRLELVLMLDSCSSERWRSMLSSRQRETLGSMLRDVLDIIAVAPAGLNLSVVERAQDRLLDEILTQCAAAPAAALGSAGGEAG